MRLGLGSVLVVFVALVVKSFVLTKAFYYIEPHHRLYFQFFISDVWICGLLLCLSLLSARVSQSQRPLSWLLSFVSAGISLLYVVDVFLIYSLDARLTLDNLAKFLPELHAATAFIDWRVVLLLVVVGATFRIRVKLSRRRVWWLAAIIVTGLGLPPIEYQEPILNKYVNREISLSTWLGSEGDPGWVERVALEMTMYRSDEIEKYKKLSTQAPKLSLPEKHPNIILLIVESLSAIHSKRTSGMMNYLPNFDRVSEEGTLFTNFIANYMDTEGGLVSLVQAQAPIPPPNGSRNIYRTFMVQPSIVPELKQNNYAIEFVTTAPISFLNKGDYLRALGVDVVVGRDEVEAFRTAPKAAFNAPPDEYLYKELLERMERLRAGEAPFFLFAITVSSHLPFVSPTGQPSTEEEVWRYVDAEIGKFADELNSRNFFDDGLLLVLGDHRRMLPLSAEEVQRYGETADARVPLLVIGNGVAKGVVDTRPLQQGDLFPMLKAVLTPGAPLSKTLYNVSTYSRIRPTSGSHAIKVFVPDGDEFRTFYLEPLGRKLRWINGEPTNSEEILQSIHSMRALHQERLAQKPKDCVLEFEAAGKPGEVGGLELRSYRGTDINGAFSPDRSVRAAQIRELTTRKVNLLSLGISREFALQLRGFLRVPVSGIYEFETISEGGVCFSVNGEMVIDQNYLHDRQPHFGRIRLQSGIVPIELRISQRSGEEPLEVQWKTPATGVMQEIPPENLIFPE